MGSQEHSLIHPFSSYVAGCQLTSTLPPLPSLSSNNNPLLCFYFSLTFGVLTLLQILAKFWFTLSCLCSKFRLINKTWAGTNRGCDLFAFCPGPMFKLFWDLPGPMQLYRALRFLYRKNLLGRLVLVWSTVIRCNFAEPEPMQPKRLPLPLNKSLNVDKTLIWDHFRPRIFATFWSFMTRIQSPV